MRRDNNAGINRSAYTTTADGLESTFATNHLAPFLLTHLLLPLLRAGAPSRVVTVTSSAHAARLDLGVFQGADTYRGPTAYAQSKLCNLLFTYELARRLQGTGVTVNCVHPGVVDTNLARDVTGPLGLLVRILKPLFSSPERAAARVLFVATAPELEGVTGGYFADRRQARSKPGSYDQAAARSLRQASERLTGLAATPNDHNQQDRP